MAFNLTASLIPTHTALPCADSPPALEVAAPVTAAGTVSGSQAPQAVLPKRVPGKLALCKVCGNQSEDIATCTRCRRKLGEDVKLLDDPAYKPKPDSTDTASKKALRAVRPPSFQKKKRVNDEPVSFHRSRN